MRVVIATDGSELAMAAGKRGLRLIASDDAEVHIVSATGHIPTPALAPGLAGFGGAVMQTPEEAQRFEEAATRESRRSVDETAAVLGLANATRKILVGTAGPAICEYADQIDADVVVAGSHGRGLVASVLLGSVSRHLVENAPTSVLIVRSDVALER